MFGTTLDALDEAIGDLEIPLDGGILARCLALWDRFTAKVTEAVGEADRAEVWRDSGAVSMTAWLRVHAGRSHREATSLTRTAKRLAGLPEVAGAYLDGTLSSGQVQAIVTNLDDRIAPLFAEAEATMVPTLAALSVADVSTAMQSWAQAAKDHLQDLDPDDTAPERSLHLSRTLDGRRELSGSLDPEAGAVAEAALRLAQSPDVDGEPARSPARLRADALVDILRFFLDHQTDKVGGRHRPHLNVFVDHEDLVGEASGDGWLPDGTVLSRDVVSRLGCDAALHRVVTKGRSSILDYGHSTRTAPANLFAAVLARDLCCRFPGCDRPAHWCEAHHVTPWEHGGPTSLGNLVLLCSRHHHLLHQPGWRAELRPDEVFAVTTPHGRTYESPPRCRPPNLWRHAA